MHFTGQVYRHPMEASTQLLEVTVGCSHNKCSFCTMYRQTPFSTSPLEHIEEDLKELKTYRNSIKRFFLVNGEPFVLATKKLIDISKLIQKYYPEVEVISCYASIKNLKNKSLEDLKLLKEYKYDQFHIGLETAYDPALEVMNKGFNQAEAYENLGKLIAAGLTYDAHVLLGVAGNENGDTHIRQTAKLINKFKPYMVSVMPLGVSKGTELEVLRDNGDFIEATEMEKLEEEKLLLNLLEFEDAYFFGSHTYNLIPMSGPLTNKQHFIEHIDGRIKNLDDKVLHTSYERPNI